MFTSENHKLDAGTSSFYCANVSVHLVTWPSIKNVRQFLVCVCKTLQLHWNVRKFLVCVCKILQLHCSLLMEILNVIQNSAEHKWERIPSNPSSRNVELRCIYPTPIFRHFSEVPSFTISEKGNDKENGNYKNTIMSKWRPR